MVNIAVHNMQDLLRRPDARHWAWYAVKALGLFCLLGAVAVFGSRMHALGVALLWVLLSCISALGCAYFRVIRKESRHYLYEPGRLLARWNGGRIIAFAIAFVAAAMCVSGLFSDVFRWKALDWGIAASAAIFYPAAFFALRHFVGDQFSEAFRRASITRAAIWATIAYLCIACAIASFASPVADYPSAYAAFAAAQQEFGDSPVELLRQLGILSSLADGLANWGTSQAAGASPYLYAALKITLGVLSLAAVGSMLGACSISASEFRRMFADFSAASFDSSLPDSVPGKAADASAIAGAGIASVRLASANSALRRRYIVAAACMPVVLLAAFLGANAQLQQAHDRGELSFVENIARGAVGCAVYVLDGKTYDAQAMQAALDDASAKMSELSDEAKEALVPLVNASFDARVSNVDAYLDDYYSLPADYERLASLVGGNIEEFVAQRLQEKLDAGIDDSELSAKLAEYDEQKQVIAGQFEEAKAACEIDGFPEWLITSKEALDQTLVDNALEPDQAILSFEQRLGVSAAAGVGVGIATKAISKKVVERAVEKQFFKNIVSRITTVLGSRATGGVVGAAIGTAAGPVGTAIGIAAGTAASIGVDYALLKVDESQNRDSYKSQITQAIEEERSDVLSMLG